MPRYELKVGSAQLHAEQLRAHTLLDFVIEVPLSVLVLDDQHRPVAVEHLTHTAVGVYALLDLTVEVGLSVLLKVLLHLNEEDQILLRELMVLEDVGCRDLPVLVLLPRGRGQPQLEYAFLHQFERIPALVVLVERFDGEVDPHGAVEDVLLRNSVPLLALDRLQQLLDLLRLIHSLQM